MALERWKARPRETERRRSEMPKRANCQRNGTFALRRQTGGHGGGGRRKMPCGDGRRVVRSVRRDRKRALIWRASRIQTISRGRSNRRHNVSEESMARMRLASPPIGQRTTGRAGRSTCTTCARSTSRRESTMTSPCFIRTTPSRRRRRRPCPSSGSGRGGRRRGGSAVFRLRRGIGRRGAGSGRR